MSCCIFQLYITFAKTVNPLPVRKYKCVLYKITVVCRAQDQDQQGPMIVELYFIIDPFSYIFT